MYCPSCGGEIAEKSTFCNHCGISVESEWMELTQEGTHGQSPAIETQRQSGSDAGETHPRANHAPSNSPGAHSHRSTSGGLEDNVAGALAYVFGFFTGLILYLAKDDNEFVRFHAAQSMIVFGGFIPLSFGLGAVQFFLGFIPVIGRVLAIGIGTLSALLGPIAIVLWVVLIYQAYQGKRYGLPVIGGWIERSI